MEWKFWKKKKKETKPKSAAHEWWNSIVFAVIAATLIRWAIMEAYVIPSGSMENTLLIGDYLFVSKFHYGTRTPRTLLQVPLTHQKIWGTNIPSYLTWIELPSFRLPGISHVKRGDIVVFNGPTLANNYGVEYPIDLKTNLVKRCIGLPGDVISVKERQVMINGEVSVNPPTLKFSYLVYSKDEINKRNFLSFGLNEDSYSYQGRNAEGKAVYKMTLSNSQADYLKTVPYIVSVSDDYTTHDGPDGTIFPSVKGKFWNGDDYGPLTIPAKGMTIPVNDSTLAFYREVIETYDHNDNVEIKDGTLSIDSKQLTEYTFKQDYFFMMGDNRHGSFDSRYWGFAPKDHVVGKALFIWFSANPEAGMMDKIRWNRIFSLIR